MYGKCRLVGWFVKETLHLAVMWIRIRICMDPQVFETPNPDPESAYFADPDPGSKEFF